MKKLILFYVIILAPLALLIVLSSEQVLDSWLLIGCGLFYALVYRTYTDGKKLADKNIIPHKDIWKLIIPGMRLRYFQGLYLS
jgi:hypothetical protein